jgi:formylglycine-generating enzyme required for sulfatase activity
VVVPLADGSVSSAKLASNLSLGGTTTGTFSGDGSGLTNLPSSSAESPANVFPARGMAWIKPGSFLMGSRVDGPEDNANETQHPVTLTKGFWIGVHEVTQAEYLAVMGSNPSYFQSPNVTADTSRPVEQVDWNSAVAYCAALTTSERTAGRIPASWGYRLPTEAEWEYCCRAGARTTQFSYDDDLNATALGNYAWYYKDESDILTHPVGQKLSNPWGLMDMHGNVFEWCQDWFDSYPSTSVTDPLGPISGSFRVARGGCYTYTSEDARCAARFICPLFLDNEGLIHFMADFIGFRAVLAPVQ